MIEEYHPRSREFGLKPCAPDELTAHDIDEAKAMLLGVLDNLPGAARDIVPQCRRGDLCGGWHKPWKKAWRRRCTAIASGEAKAKLDQLIAFSNRFKPAKRPQRHREHRLTLSWDCYFKCSEDGIKRIANGF